MYEEMLEYAEKWEDLLRRKDDELLDDWEPNPRESNIGDICYRHGVASGIRELIEYINDTDPNKQPIITNDTLLHWTNPLVPNEVDDEDAEEVLNEVDEN